MSFDRSRCKLHSLNMQGAVSPAPEHPGNSKPVLDTRFETRSGGLFPLNSMRGASHATTSATSSAISTVCDSVPVTTDDGGGCRPFEDGSFASEMAV